MCQAHTVCQNWYREESNPNKKPEASDGYLESSDFFMAVAFLSAKRSRDPKTQVGACIVNSENKVVGIGYNGMPNGCSDDDMPWRRHSDTVNILETKTLFVCHAELNAVLNKNSADVKNCSIYVTLFPCNECAKILIQSGIKEVVYYSDKYKDRPEYKASKIMFDKAGIIYRQYQRLCDTSKIVIDFPKIDSNNPVAASSVAASSVDDLGQTE